MTKRPHGQLRSSQVVTTFGPGALLDLPNQSVLVGGLDHWSEAGREEIPEPRLVEKLKRLLDLPSLRLFSPPPESEDPTGPQTGIRAWLFPEWFITQDLEEREKGGGYRSRRLIPLTALTRGKFIDEDKRRRPVVPVRFVRACRKGHIGDLDWYSFVHRGATKCRRPLHIDERGTTGDLSEIWVRCACGANRPMNDATLMQLKALGNCDGSRPWLGPMTKEPCGEPNRLLVRSASNSYFPQIMSVISLPDRTESLEQAVNQVWENFLQYVDSVEDLQRERTKKPPVKSALEGFSDDEIFQEIQYRKTGFGQAPVKSVKQAEYEFLSSTKEEVGNDTPDGNFYARSLARTNWNRPWMKAIERVVLVHRLREVTAQVGFTRFESISPDVEGELEMGVQAAPLAREVTWLPAIENKGEGIFLGFRKDAIEHWLQLPAVQERGRQLLKGFSGWQNEHPHSRRKFPGLPYVMLHSLSHLLITAVSLECGYPASAIRERVYALEEGYGILLFTGSSDAEGTMGGLVEAARQIAQHLKAALELGGLCSNDPVCAQHEPPNAHECRFLHGAACHGCLLIAEPSCEQQNDFLDRALVVATVANLGAEFFSLKEP
jgi:hypothetical protein